jgi:hypothetical protein
MARKGLLQQLWLSSSQWRRSLPRGGALFSGAASFEWPQSQMVAKSWPRAWAALMSGEEVDQVARSHTLRPRRRH